MPNYKDIKYQFPAESLVSGSVANARISSGSVTQHVQPYISWQSVTTSGITMVAGRGYPVDTSGGAITMTMPASPSVGDTLKVMDYARTFASNKLTLDRNGSPFQGATSNPQFNINGSTITVTYIDSTKVGFQQQMMMLQLLYLLVINNTQLQEVIHGRYRQELHLVQLFVLVLVVLQELQTLAKVVAEVH